MVENYNVFVTVACREYRDKVASPMDINLHSLSRRLIELRIEHADLDNLIDQATATRPDDELSVRRLKNSRSPGPSAATPAERSSSTSASAA